MIQFRLSGQVLQDFPLPIQADYRQPSITYRSAKMKYCKKCQLDTDRNACGRCKPCENKRSAVYRAENFNKVRAATIKWRNANRDKIKEYGSLYRLVNSVNVKASKSAYRIANPEKVKASLVAWHTLNPSAKCVYTQNYRARKLDNGGKLSKDIKSKLFILQKGKCPCCNQPLGEDYHLDHIMPLSLGGLNTDYNCQLLRQQCNNQKYNKHPVDFMQSRGFLL